MWDRIKAFLADGGMGSSGTGRTGQDELAVACAALMVDAALADGSFDALERQALRAALRRPPLGVAAEDADQVIDEAEKDHAQSVDLFRYLKVIGPRFTETDREALIEMMWEIAFADGELSPYEAQLLRRIAGLLGVPDSVSGHLRKRVMARLNISAQPPDSPA